MSGIISTYLAVSFRSLKGVVAEWLIQSSSGD